MVGFYFGDPTDSRDLRDAGLDVVPSQTGEVLGATFGQAMADNPTTRLGEVTSRNAGDTGYLVDGFGNVAQIGQPRALMAPEDANKEFKLPGMVPFSRPVSRETAQDIFEEHRRRLERENIIARRDGGVLTGGVARFGTQLLAGALDPLNVASAFIPVVPEAKVAAWLADAGAGAIARAGVRARVGLAEGVVGAAALEPANYLLDRQTQNDWTMGNAAMNIALGAVMGGALHTGVGAVRDWRAGPADQAFADGVGRLSAESREAGMRAAVAAHVEGRPVNIADALDASEAMGHIRELEGWARQTRRLMDDTDRAVTETATAGAPDRAAALRAAEENLSRLREESNRLRADIADTTERAFRQVDDRTVRAQLDDATNARIQRVEAELAFGNLPAARRAALEQERTMLLEGSDIQGRAIAASGDNLEVQRTLAERTALQRELARRQGEAATAERSLAGLRQEIEAARMRAEAEGRVNERSWKIQEAAIESRAEVLQALAERTIRRYAAWAGVDAGDVSALATRLLTAEDPATAIRAEFARMGRNTPERAGVPTPEDMAAQSEMSGALSRLYGYADEATRMAHDQQAQVDARIEDTARRVDELKQTAPKAEGQVAEQIAELQRDQATLDATIAAERDAGRFTPEQERILRDFDEAAKTAEGDARAMEAAGYCAAVRG